LVIFSENNQGVSRRTGGYVLSFWLELNSFILDELHTSQGQVIYPVQFLGNGTSYDSSSSIGKCVYLSLYYTCVEPINVTVFAEIGINPVHSTAGYLKEGADYLTRH
jgi:hypothetical protein